MTNNVHRRDFLKAVGAATAAVWDGTRAEAADTTSDWPNDLSAHRIAKIETWSSPDRERGGGGKGEEGGRGKGRGGRGRRMGRGGGGGGGGREGGGIRGRP